MEHLISAEKMEQRIFMVRGQKVMIDRHLAELFAVPPRSLNLAVKRKIEKFPENFRFRLTKEEFELLKVQLETLDMNVNSNYLPYAYTERSIGLVAKVLRRNKATQISILILKAFMKLSEVPSEQTEHLEQIKMLEHRMTKHSDTILRLHEFTDRLNYSMKSFKEIPWLQNFKKDKKTTSKL